VRDRAGGDGKIKESEEIADPESGADARRIDDGITECSQILRLGGERCRLRFLWRRLALRLLIIAATSPSRPHSVEQQSCRRRQSEST
jgi:hypothetical protein